MPRAELTIRLPADLWIGSITREFPSANFRILAVFPGEDTGVGLVEVTTPELAAVIRDLDTAGEISELTILRRQENTALLQFETTEPTLLFPIVGSGIPLELPFTMSDGAATWEITTSQERLSALGDQLTAFDIEYTVEEIRYHLHDEPLLTDRQYELIRAAVEAGYYDTPRSCTLTDLAEREEISKSTVSETLHRAEGTIIREFLRNSDADR